MNEDIRSDSHTPVGMATVDSGLSVVPHESEDDLRSQSIKEKPFKEPNYTILTDTEKYAMLILLSISGVWSSISGSIYFPALPILTEKFNVTPAIANILVVTYLIFQGIGPTFIAFFADTYGRRPCVVACLLVYCAICVVISQTNVYWLLAVLRCVQAASIAPLIAVSTGAAGDIYEIYERGKFVGLILGLQLVGQGFGPLIGAFIVHGFSWRGIFIFLAIGSGVVFIIALFILPETNRSLVGNLSIPPKHIINKLPILRIPYFKNRLTNESSTLRKNSSSWKLLLMPYKILIKKDVFLALIPAGMQFTVWTMSLTTIATSLDKTYHYPITTIGLCYIPSGIGTVLGSVITGRLIDLNYAKKYKNYMSVYGHLSPEERPKFDLILARLELCIVSTILLILFSVVFGWCLQYRVNIAPILISAFIISYCSVALLSALTTLLVDMFPGHGSALTSCVNLMRCLLGAVGIGVLQDMVDSMGEGGCYTLMAGFCLISGLVFQLTCTKKGKI